MLTPNTPESRKPGVRLRAHCPRDTSTSGGSRLTEQKALTVRPSGSPLGVAGGDDGDAARELGRGPGGSRGVDGHGRERHAASAGPPASRRARAPPVRPGSPRGGRCRRNTKRFEQDERDDLRLVAGRAPSAGRARDQAASPTTASAVISSTCPNVRTKLPHAERGRRRGAREARSIAPRPRSGSPSRSTRGCAPSGGRAEARRGGRGPGEGRALRHGFPRLVVGPARERRVEREHDRVDEGTAGTGAEAARSRSPQPWSRPRRVQPGCGARRTAMRPPARKICRTR